MDWVLVFIILPRIRFRHRNLDLLCKPEGHGIRQKVSHAYQTFLCSTSGCQGRRRGHGVTLSRLSCLPYFNQLFPTFCFVATFPYFYPYFFTLKCHHAIKVNMFFLTYFFREQAAKHFIFYILKDFRNSPFYNHCPFYLADLRMFLLSFLSDYTIDHDLP